MMSQKVERNLRIVTKEEEINQKKKINQELNNLNQGDNSNLSLVSGAEKKNILDVKFQIIIFRVLSMDLNFQVNVKKNLIN